MEKGALAGKVDLVSFEASEDKVKQIFHGLDGPCDVGLGGRDRAGANLKANSHRRPQIT